MKRLPPCMPAIGPYSVRMVTALEVYTLRKEDMLALVEAALEDGCTFAQIGLELRSECAFDAGEAIAVTRQALATLAGQGNRAAQQIIAQTFFYLPQQAQ